MPQGHWQVGFLLWLFVQQLTPLPLRLDAFTSQTHWTFRKKLWRRRSCHLWRHSFFRLNPWTWTNDRDWTDNRWPVASFVAFPTTQRSWKAWLERKEPLLALVLFDIVTQQPAVVWIPLESRSLGRVRYRTVTGTGSQTWSINHRVKLHRSGPPTSPRKWMSEDDFYVHVRSVYVCFHKHPRNERSMSIQSFPFVVRWWFLACSPCPPSRCGHVANDGRVHLKWKPTKRLDKYYLLTSQDFAMSDGPCFEDHIDPSHCESPLLSCKTVTRYPVSACVFPWQAVVMLLLYDMQMAAKMQLNNSKELALKATRWLLGSPKVVSAGCSFSAAPLSVQVNNWRWKGMCLGINSSPCSITVCNPCCLLLSSSFHVPFCSFHFCKCHPVHGYCFESPVSLICNVQIRVLSSHNIYIYMYVRCPTLDQHSHGSKLLCLPDQTWKHPLFGRSRQDLHGLCSRTLAHFIQLAPSIRYEAQRVGRLALTV